MLSAGAGAVLETVVLIVLGSEPKMDVWFVFVAV